ncbi:endonuclease III [Candidatus Tisiphia endosymbiont of Nemotelus uliginosus]|uniref:endonuclease III n=1 Tax=Candidatus Tisiphia endosymbiont of Nemotelus uliginosus TaxID=3077926 RepID=UPI0035C8CD88
MQAEIIDKIFSTLSKANPTPRTELQYVNNFTLLIAVILSAQATDASVNKATSVLFTNYNTPQQILELGEIKLRDYIKSIGLFITKAKNIIALCQILIDKYDSKVPDNLEDLIKLPGVGRKTANVILNCLFDKATMAVDTHVFRVARRLGLAHGHTTAKVEQELLNSIDIKWMKYAHHWLILLGRYICKARSPSCPSCPVKDYCEYYANINSIVK